MVASIAHTLTIVLAKKDPDKFEALLDCVPNVKFTELSLDKAFEITSDFPVLTRLAADLEETGIKFDQCLQSTEVRRKKLLICDMDSTLIGQECINELADFAGFKDHVAQITEKAMRGEIGFDGALEERVALLKDLPLSTLQTCFEERITLNRGADVLARTMKAHGAETVIVSGGFTFFSERVASAAGFEHHHANILLDNGQLLTGEVKQPILGREAKLATMRDYTRDMGGPISAIAIGDGANDLDMIIGAGLGIAYRAKPAVAAAADCAINHTDLTTALYFQGFKDEDFA